MEIFILYKFYIFFILKSYFKKICAPKPGPQNTPARDRLPHAAEFQHRQHEGAPTDTGRVTRFRFRTSVATGHSSVSTTVSITGDLTLNISTLTPQGTMKNLLVPSLKYQMLYFSITPNCMCLCI